MPPPPGSPRARTSDDGDDAKLYNDGMVGYVNINHLYYFQTVCKYNNVTRAAENLHVSQPSITAAIKELERELGIELFHKVGNRIFLTPEGGVFLERAKSFLQTFEDFQTETIDISANKKARLIIGIPTILGTLLLSKILPEFNRLYPDIDLKIYEVPTLVGARMIDEATLDFALGINDNGIYKDVDSKIIYKTELVLFVNRNNPLAKEAVITEAMLKEVPFVILLENSYHYHIITERLKDVQPNFMLHSNQLSTIKYMLENDLAVTILYKEIFKENEKFCAIPLKRPIIANISILWRRFRYISHAMKAFISYMSENVKII